MFDTINYNIFSIFVSFFNNDIISVFCNILENNEDSNPSIEYSTTPTQVHSCNYRSNAVPSKINGSQSQQFFVKAVAVSETC